MKTKEYVRPMPATWWLHNYHLALFMIRELTSLFVAGYAVFLMVLLYRCERPFFFEFVDGLGSPGAVALQLIVLAFVLFHAVTWLNLTPKVVILWRGEEKVPAPVISGAHYLLWLIVSIVIWIIVVG